MGEWKLIDWDHPLPEGVYYFWDTIAKESDVVKVYLSEEYRVETYIHAVSRGSPFGFGWDTWDDGAYTHYQEVPTLTQGPEVRELATSETPTPYDLEVEGGGRNKKGETEMSESEAPSAEMQSVVSAIMASDRRKDCSMEQHVWNLKLWRQELAELRESISGYLCNRDMRLAADRIGEARMWLGKELERQFDTEGTAKHGRAASKTEGSQKTKQRRPPEEED